MQIRVTRYDHNQDSTSGLLAINHDGEGAKGAEHFGYTLEDQRQPGEKVMSETRIPENSYTLGYQEIITPMTERYRKKYPWFDKHLHVKNVPNFKGIYIHIGNTDEDTAGCLLVGDIAYNDPKDFNSTIGKSTQCFKRFYEVVCAALDRGEEVTIVYKSIYE